MTLIAALFDCCEDVARIVKAAFAMVLACAATGLAMQAKGEVNLMMRRVTRHTGLVAFFSNVFTLSFLFMFLVDVFALLYTCLGCGCIRYYIFRERANESAKCRMFQCIIGPCCATVQQVMVWLTLTIQILVSYGYVMFAVFLKSLLFLCHSGNTVVNSFQGFLDTYHSRQGYQAGAFSPLNWLMNLNIEKYCMATRGMNRATMQCFTGCLLSVVAQVIMLMVVSEEKGRIEGTMAEGVQGGLFGGSAVKDKKRSSSRRSNSSSSSSSSSDDSPTKRRTTALAAPTAGGLNYTLPGGFKPNAQARNMSWR
jgi:hypothetical protein